MSAGWMARAACARPGVDPDLFFPDKGQRAPAAIAICERCPVRVPCLDFARAAGQRHGVWGGTVPEQRDGRRAARRARYTRDPAARERHRAEASARRRRTREAAAAGDPAALARLEEIRTQKRAAYRAGRRAA